MRKITFILFCLFYQQIQSQSAPDFTVTDINGNQHTLSQYLQQGKSVILEFSETSCGPSWKYRRTEALSDFYNSNGPSGSDEIMVLFLENSNYSTLLDLQGISNPPGFGNWIEGTPFPIVLDPNTFSLYNINYFPQIFKVCPNGTLTSIGQKTATQLKTAMNACNPLNGVQNFARLITTENGFCSANGGFETILKNYGTNSIQDATVILMENGNAIGTKNFSGNIAQFATSKITFTDVTINPASTYTAQIQSINGAPNFNAAFDSSSLPFHFSVEGNTSLQLKVYTYSCPNNMSWEISNSAGEVVTTGGPYGTPGSYCNGPRNTIVEHNLTLPTQDCYSLRLIDFNGLGWKDYSGNSPVPTAAGVQILSNGELIFTKMNVENFGYQMDIPNFIKVGTLSANENAIDNLQISPNPTSGLININSTSIITLLIYDLSGKKVFEQKNIPVGSSIDISNLQNGMYVAKIINDKKEIAIKKLLKT